MSLPSPITHVAEAVLNAELSKLTPFERHDFVAALLSSCATFLSVTDRRRTAEAIYQLADSLVDSRRG